MWGSKVQGSEPRTRHQKPEENHFSIASFVAFNADRIASRLRP
jgi:hypothetical protein